MEGRTTVYNKITTPEKIAKINPKNKQLIDDFLDYLSSVDRSRGTLDQYKSNLFIFFVWNLENNDNKDFIKITKRELSRFQNHAINTWQWSPKRIRSVKSAISSLSNFIENILDEEEEFQNWRSIIKKIESPANETVRKKTVYEDKELQGLLDYLVENKKYMQACLLALAMYSGRRKSELLRFKVDFFNDENVIFGSLYKTPEKVKTKGRGVRGKPLTLYVLKKGFDKYLNLWLDERERLGITSEWLFPAKKADGWSETETLSISTIDAWTDNFSKLTGKPFYWHSLRHFFTTSCSKSGLPQNVIKELIGWDSIEMVNLYLDLDIEDTLGDYFNEDGIVAKEHKSLADL